MNVQEKISLQSYNTFGVSVNAKYFTKIKSNEELIDAILFAKKNNCEMLFLGGGSNVLFTKDFDGLVVVMETKGIVEEKFDDNTIIVTAQAGENWHNFVLSCIDKNFGGLENLSLIPGNVGTSPIQNIGAYGVEIKDVFQSCKVLNIETLTIEKIELSQCQFGYRDSIFKSSEKGKFVILEVSFLLSTQHHTIHSTYGAIKTELEKMKVSNPSIKDISNAVIAIRESKLPNPKIIGNAGSFFKNPTIDFPSYENLKKDFPTISGYPNDSGVKLAAGWLIEQAGWKGKEIGNVATHHLQSLVIINKSGKATGEEIYNFSEKIIQSVQEKFGIILEREVNIL